MTAAGPAIDIWNGKNGAHVMRLPLGRGKAVLGAALDPTGNLSSAEMRAAMSVSGRSHGHVAPVAHPRPARRFSRFRSAATASECPRGKQRGHVYVLGRRGARSLGSIDAGPHQPWLYSTPLGHSCSSRTPTGGAGIWSVKGGRSRNAHRRAWSIFANPAHQTGARPVCTIRAAAFSADGKFIVTGNNDGTAAFGRPRPSRRAKAREGDRLTHDRHRGNEHRVQPRQREAACASLREVQMGARRSGARRRRRASTVLRGHTDQIGAVAFSLDDRQIVTASDDRTAAVWELVSGVRQSLLAGHRDSVVACGLQPDGKRILTAGAGGTARLWRAPAPQAADRVLRLRLGTCIRRPSVRDGAHVLIAGSEGLCDHPAPASRFSRRPPTSIPS